MYLSGISIFSGAPSKLSMALALNLLKLLTFFLDSTTTDDFMTSDFRAPKDVSISSLVKGSARYMLLSKSSDDEIVFDRFGLTSEFWSTSLAICFATGLLNKPVVEVLFLLMEVGVG